MNEWVSRMIFKNDRITNLPHFQMHGDTVQNSKNPINGEDCRDRQRIYSITSDKQTHLFEDYWIIPDPQKHLHTLYKSEIA